MLKSKHLGGVGDVSPLVDVEVGSYCDGRRAHTMLIAMLLS